MRILGLNDDIHLPFFVCEDGTTEYSDVCDLVRFLSQPRNFEVEVRMFSLVDTTSEDLDHYTTEELNDMFDALDGYGDPPCGLNNTEIFDLFWGPADKNW